MGWRFIDLAVLGRNRVLSYALTLFAVVLFPSIFLVVSFTAIFVAAAAHWLADSAVRAMLFAAAFASLALAGGTLALSVAYIHRRPWRSLISADLTLDWRRLAIGAAVEGMLLFGVLLIGHRISGEELRFGSDISLPVLLCLLLLIPFQAAGEEMLFRGYLTQALGRLIRSRLAIALIVGALFGGLHFNAYGVLTIPYLLILSLIFSAVSLRDERLELTIGAHTAMNWLAVGAAGALGASASEPRLRLAAIAALIVHGALFYGLTRLLVRVFCRPPSPV